MKKHKYNPTGEFPVKEPAGFTAAPDLSRFDFEQEFMSCWSILEDLESTLNCSNQEELVGAIVTLYHHKFQRCFDTFETMLRAKQI